MSKKNTLFRTRIDSLLQNATKNDAVAIIAGAGYGKTLAVSSFLSKNKNETVWIYLTALDNTHIRIWELICTSFSKILNNPELSQYSKIYPFDNTVVESFINILYTQLSSDKKYYLVLDDLHNINNPLIFNIFEKLILSRIPNLCIILISRNEIPISINTLIGKGILSQINSHELILTKEELADYFEKNSIEITTQAISDFYEYTKGWFFSAHLVCMLLKKDTMYKVSPLSTIKEDIFSILENTTYSSFSNKIKNYLLKFSLLERLPLGLAVNLSNNDWPLVNQAIKSTSFIEIDSFNDNIRFHPLFLQFLDNKKNSLSTSEQKKVHFFAAKWFQKNNMRIDAIFHYEKIQRYDLIIPILLTFKNAFSKQTMNFLIDVINRMPEKILNENPVLHFLKIKFLMNNFDMADVNLKLLEFSKRLEELDPSPNVISALGEIYAHLGFQSLITCSSSHTYEFVNYFKLASIYLPKGSSLIHRPYIANGNYICNVSNPQKGEFIAYIESIKKMIPYASKVIPNTFEGYDNLATAEYLFFQKKIKESEKYLMQAKKDSHINNSSFVEINALYLETRINLANGYYSKIKNTLLQQEKLALNINSSEAYTVLDITKSWFYCQIGYHNLVSSWINDEEKSKEMLTPVTFSTDKLIRAQCLLAKNNLSELLAMLSSKEDGFQFENYLIGRIELKVIKAIALHLLNENYKSLIELREAYELAHPNNLILPFVEQGKYMRTLLNKTNTIAGIPESWIADIKVKSTIYAKKLSAVRTEFNLNHMNSNEKPVLSKREIDVLICIAQNMTRDEISSSNNLSINTVKSITKNIYNKLGVSSNVEAVRIATKLNII